MITTQPTTNGTEPSADGLDLEMETIGSGAPVLLLHGGGGPSMVTTIRDHFVTTRHVLVPVHPGWESTPHPTHLDSVGALAAYYLTVLRERNLGGVTVIGTSFGGWIATEMASQDDSNLIGRLVIIDGVGLRPHPGHQPVLDEKAQAFSPDNSGEAFDLMYRYAGTDLWDDSLADHITHITVPTLVVWGADDPVLTTDYGRMFAAAIPGSRFAEIPAAGHLPADDNPELTFATIDGFLVSTPLDGDVR